MSPKRPRTLHLKRALLLVWHAAPGWTGAGLALIGLQAGLPLLQLYLLKLTVDAVAAGIAALTQVVVLVGFTGATALAMVFLMAVARVVGEAQADVVTDHVQDLLHAKSVALDLEYYENSRFYDTLHRAQQEASYRPTHLVNGLGRTLLNCVSLLGIAGLLFSCHWGVAAVLMAALAPGVLVRLKFAARLFEWRRARSATERRAAYLSWLLTGEYHAKEIRLFALGSLLIGRFRELRRQIRQERIGLALKQTLSDLAAQAGATLAIFGALAFIAYRAVQGYMTLGDMVLYYQAFQRGQGYLREMLAGLAGLYEDNLFLGNFYDFLDLQPTVIEPRRPVPAPRPLERGIVFDRVSFQYPAGAAPVLREVSLTIPPGQVVALVGENGSGKTTLVKLLCRLYDPTTGRITVDGLDLRRLESAAWRREIGIIFQDYAHYQMTARENIWMGNIELAPAAEKIETAAKISGAHAIFTKLPQGYDTMLGNWFADGAELSSGQWQKVALGRALVRDAQIVVLDEPTSSLDVRAEAAVFQHFRRLAAGRTAILISHRFSSIRMADFIYVLQDGRIIEGGSHEELRRRGGAYAHLFETQARHYRR